MTFSYVIIYVTSVEKTLAFYEEAFGFKRLFLHESGDYGQVDTGATALAFASLELATSNFGAHQYTPLSIKDTPPGIEIGFVTEDVETAYARAINAGATPLAPPALKPWGQTVSYVRAMEGTIIEICSPL